MTYAVYLWPVHCECAMKHDRRRIFNYLQIRDTGAKSAKGVILFLIITLFSTKIASQILVSIVVSIPACHAGDRGSIPRRGVLKIFLDFYLGNQGSDPGFPLGGGANRPGGGGGANI